MFPHFSTQAFYSYGLQDKFRTRLMVRHQTLTDDHIYRQLSEQAPDGGELSLAVQSTLLPQVVEGSLYTGGWGRVDEGKGAWVSQVHTLHLQTQGRKSYNKSRK